MDWLTHLFMYGQVTLTGRLSDARPAFTNPSEEGQPDGGTHDH